MRRRPRSRSRSRSRSRRRSPLPLLLLLAGLVAGVGLAELFLRLHPVLPPGLFRTLDAGNREAACTRNSLTRGWAPIPGECGRDAHGTLAHGATAEEEAGRAEDAARRWLVLGDSVSAGDQWVGAVAELVTADEPDLRVHNAAVSGYDTCQELETWRELGPVLRPELVVLQTCPNDAVGSFAMVPLEGDRVRYHVHRDGEARAAVDFPIWILHSRLLSLAVLSWATATAPMVEEHPSMAARYAQACLRILADEVRGSGGDLVAVAFPVLAPRDSAADRGLLQDEALVDQLLRDEGVPTLWVRSLLDEDALVAARTLPDDPLHPSPEAHRALAPAIAAFLQQERRSRPLAGPESRPTHRSDP